VGYHVTISLIVILCNLVSATTAAGRIDEAGQMDFSPDIIIVKLKQGVSVGLPDQEGSDTSGLDLHGLSPFNRMLPRNRTVHVKPLFKDFKRNQKQIKALLNGDRFALSQKKKHLLQRLNRAPQNVAIPDLSRIYRIKVNLEAGESLHDILTAYQNSPYVEYAEPDYYVRLCLIPNDPNYPQQWALSKIDAPPAWDIHTGSHDVVVAVIDTGVDYTHPDLQGNIWVNELELNGCTGVDDDENGYIDDIYGYDFAYDDCEPQDDSGHGTHIAGIIAAKGNNNTNVSGICWNARIMAVKAKITYTLGPASLISEAIYYAVSNGADVLSCSWSMDPPSNLLYDSFQYAYSQGVVAVAAAGNQNSNNVIYPAGYSTVISVGASTQSDQRASFSNYGDWVDIMAPGVDILSLFHYGRVYSLAGTSMACPHVAGACALMLSVNPYLTPDEVRQAILSTGDAIAPGICLSNARVNLFKAVSSVVSSTGTVHFDRDVYSCKSTISVLVSDADLKESAACEVLLTTDHNEVEALTLTENAPAIGVFQGSITTNAGTTVSNDGVLQVFDGDIVTVAYLDRSGAGRLQNGERTVTDRAVIDGQVPIVSHVVIDASSSQPTVNFETDEPTTVVVKYCIAGSPEFVYSVPGFVIYSTHHSIVLNEVAAQTDYTFVIEVEDRVGNTTRDDNDGLFYGFTTIADQGQLYVPADYTTIQAAIDQCWDGDTVWVADGTYTGPGNRDIDFKGKAITVRSENGPQACIIDCQGSKDDLHRGFYFHHRETQDSILDGFTITGGHQEGNSADGTICRGSGILCNASSPTIKNCIFRNNFAVHGGGGGIHIYNNSNVTLTNCIFIENTAQRGAGVNNDESIINLTDCLFSYNVALYYGGLYSGGENSQTTLTRCIFRENSAFQGAGALGIGGHSAMITRCEFIGNTATGSDQCRGGAIDASHSDITIQECIFSGNENNAGAGALGIYGHRAVITNCEFVGNIANARWGWSGGGALGVSLSDISIRGCIFSGNKSNASGGGLYQYMGQVDLTNCTFVGNVSSQNGRAVACFAYEDNLTLLQATNCIFWDRGDELFKDENAELNIRYSDVQGGYPGVGNIYKDPRFVDSGCWDNFDPRPGYNVWTNGDYHLLSQAGYWSTVNNCWLVAPVNSPCIDAGDPNSPVGQEPEPNGGRINMGAYGGTDQASRSNDG
jgi:hypothetical protein